MMLFGQGRAGRRGGYLQGHNFSLEQKAAATGSNYRGKETTTLKELNTKHLFLMKARKSLQLFSAEHRTRGGCGAFTFFRFTNPLTEAWQSGAGLLAHARIVCWFLQSHSKHLAPAWEQLNWHHRIVYVGKSLLKLKSEAGTYFKGWDRNLQPYLFPRTAYANDLSANDRRKLP